MRLRKMSVAEYDRWIEDDRSRDASLPEFFGSGVARTRNVLAGTATDASVVKWRSFRARHGTAFLRKPTYKRAIALRNWGIAVKIPKRRGDF